MKDNRNNLMPQMFPFANMQNMAQMGTLPTNMMMVPNFMNDNYSSLENKVNSLEKKINVLENRLSRLENPYQTTNTQSYQNTVTSTQNGTPQYQTTQSGQTSYQTTQNNTGYNGEMYMM